MSSQEPPYEDAPPDIVELLDELERLVGESRRMPLSRNVVVDPDRFMELVDLLRETVPAEIRQAQRVVRERERIIGEAQAEASKILTAARSRGEYWASEDAILNEVRQRSEKMLRHAEEERRRNIGEVEMFALDRLTDFEAAIRDGFSIIHEAMREAVARLDQAIVASGDTSHPAEDDRDRDRDRDREDRHG